MRSKNAKTASRIPGKTSRALAEVRAGKARRVKGAKALFHELNASGSSNVTSENITRIEIHPTRSETLVALVVGRALSRKPCVNAELLTLFRRKSDLLLENATRPHSVDGRRLSEILKYLQEAGGSEIDRLRWFLTPNVRLSGNAPFDLLHTGRTREVVDAAHTRADIGR